MIPRVTVVTPTLNAERYFHDCLASLEAQRELVTVEHIVVDDGSTDATRDMAVAAGATVFDGERAGLYAAMNLGLAHASGDYVGVLNADDYLYPGALTSSGRGHRPKWSPVGDRHPQVGRRAATLRWNSGTAAGVAANRSARVPGVGVGRIIRPPT